MINTQAGDTCAIQDSSGNPIFFQKTRLGLPTVSSSSSAQFEGTRVHDSSGQTRVGFGFNSNPQAQSQGQIFIVSYPYLNNNYSGQNVSVYLSATGNPPANCKTTDPVTGQVFPNLYNSKSTDSCSVQYQAGQAPTVYQQTTLGCPFTNLQVAGSTPTLLTFSSDPVYGNQIQCIPSPISDYCTSETQRANTNVSH